MVTIETSNSNSATGYAYFGPTNSKPPRGYCTQISRAINPGSRCYEHLIGSRLKPVSDKKNNANLNEQEQEEEQQQQHVKEGLLNSKGEELVYVRLETFGATISELKTSAVNERLLVGVLTRLLGVDNKKRTILNNNNIEKNFNNNNIRAQILAADGPEGARLADKCRLSIEKFLCRLAYPVCHFRRADVSALVRPPCREDCLLLKDVLCSNLDWSQFTTALSQAFNATLSSVINALDLEAQGEQLALLEEEGAHFSTTNKPLNNNKLFRMRNNNWHKETKTNSLIDYNLNSSIHLYWPHEHSIERCELLPPLRSVDNSAGQEVVKNYNHFQRHPHNNINNNKSSTRIYQSGRRRKRAFNTHNAKYSNLKWPICSNAHLTSVHTNPQPKHEDSSQKECLKSEDGFDYNGHKNSTRSGLSCQQWQSQWPHAHTSSELLFDNMKEAHNYCRNPGGIELKPFCYTMDKSVRWEYCDIVKC